VTRLAREVVTKAKLGGQAEVKGVLELWKESHESSELDGGNLTNQSQYCLITTVWRRATCRPKSRSTFAVKFWNLKNRHQSDVRSAFFVRFAVMWSRVAREVGTECKLGDRRMYAAWPEPGSI